MAAESIEQPQYGVRTGQTPVPGSGQGAGQIIREAAALDVRHLAAAIDRRLTSEWADGDNPLLSRLQHTHPNAYQAAKKQVSEVLGNNVRWLARARSAYHQRLAPVSARRKTSGKLKGVSRQRMSLLLGLSAPSGFVLSAGLPLETLVVVGAGSLLAAAVLGEALTVKLRLPVPGKVRRGWLDELRADVENAVLLAVVEKQGIDVDAPTARAASRGWLQIRRVAERVDALDSA